MNNNGMIEYKENFITKIKNFFKRLFGKNKEREHYIQENSVKELQEEQQKTQNDFIDNIKVDTNAINSINEKRKFLDEIKGNEEALNMLSTDRLKKLDEYYDSVIAENDKKIKKLKAST